MILLIYVQKKFGASSLDRNNLLEHYSKQIIDNSVSPYASFLIERASSNFEMFDFLATD